MPERLREDEFNRIQPEIVDAVIDPRFARADKVIAETLIERIESAKARE